MPKIGFTNSKKTRMFPGLFFNKIKQITDNFDLGLARGLIMIKES